jgi:hypothetical protein
MPVDALETLRKDRDEAMAAFEVAKQRLDIANNALLAALKEGSVSSGSVDLRCGDQPSWTTFSETQREGESEEDELQEGSSQVN